MPLMILVADDEPGIRLSITHYLEMSGYSAITAENGKEALAMVEEYQPDLIVTDIVMPQMDGYELVQKVRQRPAFRLVPVIFLTERKSKEERILGYNVGCDAYLPKPFELDELGAVIRNLLERSRTIYQSAWRSRVQLLSTQTQEPETSHAPATANLMALNLTPREQEVLDVLTKGLSNVEIGTQMHLSPRTVEKYVSSLLRKTQTNNRAELVRFALDNHLVN